MRKWMLVLLTVLLFLSLTVPVFADDGQGQAVLPGESVVIGPGEEVNGDLAVMGGKVELQEGGRVNGNAVVLGGAAIIDGEVDGHLVVMGGTLDLRSHALVRQNLFTLGASVTRAPGATVRGETIEGFRGRMPRLPILPRIPTTWPAVRTWRWQGEPFFNLLRNLMMAVLRTIALIVLGVLLVLLLPKQMAQIGHTAAEAALPSIGVGLLTFLVLLFLVPLLVVICIGIPVAVLLVLAAVAAGVLGWIAIGTVIGQRLLAALKVLQAQPLLEVAVGVAVITLLSEVPCLGWLFALVLGALGLGAVVLTRFGTMDYPTLSKVMDLPAPPPTDSVPTPPTA